MSDLTFGPTSSTIAFETYVQQGVTTFSYMLTSPVDAMCHHLVACSFLVFDIMCEVVLGSDVSNFPNGLSQNDESQPNKAHEPHVFQEWEQPQFDSVLQTTAAHGSHVVLAYKKCW